MYQNRPRRFRRRPNGRQNNLHDNGDIQTHLRSNSFSNNQARNHFRMPQSAEKLFEKYNTLAKEAIETAKVNSKNLSLEHRSKFKVVDINKFNLGRYDLIVSNPPYIPSRDIRNLSKDI